METLLKEQIVTGWIREYQSTVSDLFTIPSSIIWLILFFIDENDEFISEYWSSTMKREIITIQIGQCGNHIGNAFWNTICHEHKVNKHDGTFAGDSKQRNWWTSDQRLLDKIHVHFSETEKLRFVPRTCLIDLDPQIIDKIKVSPMGLLFKLDNICSGTSSAGNNWAKGHYTNGVELIDEAVDILRKEVESCNCPQGFQLTQSLGGGTGSGMGSLMLIKIRDNYPDRIISTFSVYPSPKVSDVVVEPYNAMLSIHQLLENSDATNVIDNEALFSISHNVLKQKEPKYCDLNWVISMVMSGVTCSLRFSGKLNGDLRKMCVNLVPFARLHFFLLAQAP
eukprot:399512_1